MHKAWISIFLFYFSHVAYCQTVTFATWNLAWLRSTPLTEDQFNQCKAMPSKERKALDETHLFKWTPCKSPANVKEMAAVAQRLNADVISVQEVESPEALEQIWPKEKYDYFINMKSPWIQRTGFVVRKSQWLKVGELIDVPGLGKAFKNHVRHGAELPVTVNGKTIKLLSVHLKAGCANHLLNSGKGVDRDPESCNILKAQGPALEQWIDDTIADNFPAIIIGDFNRRFDLENMKSPNREESLMAVLTTGNPPDAALYRLTEHHQAIQGCSRDESRWMIDHALLTKDIEQNFVKNSLKEHYVPRSASDHCALTFKMNF